MNAHALRLLLVGEYICPVRYRDEFNLLEDADEQEAINTWLESLNMRLARLGEEGAFFMAPAYIGQKDITQVKNELLKFRDEYGPAVQLLDFIRQTDAGRVYLSPGSYIALYELEAAVSQSTMLETQLKSLLGVISSAAQRNTNHENLRRLLEQLVKDGYAVLANKDSGTYRITGKIEQLYAVLQFLDENKVIPDSEVDDREGDETMGDLVDAAQADEGIKE
jgi:predicted transcriptional regulator